MRCACVPPTTRPRRSTGRRMLGTSVGSRSKQETGARAGAGDRGRASPGRSRQEDEPELRARTPAEPGDDPKPATGLQAEPSSEASRQASQPRSSCADGTEEEGGAKASDARLTGHYVIVMDCATCDLGSDISHGHYAGWDKERERVRSLLRGVAKCFLRGCEEKGLIHGDIKPMNIVLSTEAGAPVLKLIDFDASARHGDLCHLKYSSAFAPPQLAAELLEYEHATADGGALWASDEGARGSQGQPAGRHLGLRCACFQDGVKAALIFQSTESDNIVKHEDLETWHTAWSSAAGRGGACCVG